MGQALGRGQVGNERSLSSSGLPSEAAFFPASLLLSPSWPLRFGYFCDPCSYSVPIRGRSVLQRGLPFWSWRDL